VTGLVSLLLLAAAAQAAEPVDAEARRAARQSFEQLLAEEDHVSHFTTYQGHDVVTLTTRGRAARGEGLCEQESLTIERAPPDRLPTPESSAIRETRTEKSFLVLTDERERPLWALKETELERRCAEIYPGTARWFSADDADTARSAIHGLFALKAELSKPSPAQVEWKCGPRQKCPEPAGLSGLINPLSPSGARRSDPDCPKHRFCVDVLVMVSCGAWNVQLRMEPVDIDRFRSARIGFIHGHHCGEMGMGAEASAE
jgi:hypothetical protein